MPKWDAAHSSNLEKQRRGHLLRLQHCAEAEHFFGYATRTETRSDVLTTRLKVQSAALERSAALRSVLPPGGVGLNYSTTGCQRGAGFSTENYQSSFEASYDPDGPPGEQTGESGEGVSAQP